VARRRWWLTLIAVSLASSARADDAKDWSAFAEARSGECLGPRGSLAAPIEISAGGRRYRLEGHRLVEQGGDRDRVLRLGVISAVKDDREPTLENIKTLIARFKKAKVDVLIANGDLSTNTFEMEHVFAALAESGVLVLAHIGNTESCGSFNQVATATFEKHPNFINGNWVRRLELDDGVLLTLPGYYNRSFTHASGAAVYKEDDLEELREIARGAPEPRILVSHGPPQMKGKKAIDLATDGGNVGDPLMLELIKDLKIPFQICGHILEAGGRGTDLAGKPRKPGKWHPTLYVNAGTANPDPWVMLDRSTSYGMGLLVEVDRKKARFKVERLKRRY
jgi:Icc-related predicted phosphoesterase